MVPETLEEMFERMKRENNERAEKVAEEMKRLNDAAKQEEELEDFNVSDVWTD